ncbi:HSP20-like chaperone [Lactarius pseudohatsudake]|nr:HSP20-like chaperone [Lactarius pseudohatsudake]
MTVKVPQDMNKHARPSKSSLTDRYRSLDRALATRYVHLVLAHRRRLAAAQHGVTSEEPMRPRVEICDQPQSHFVTATFELPGLKKEEIGVHLTHDGRLTISGDRRPPPFLFNTDPALPMYPMKELKYGRFERTINVPAGLEVKDINASLADGMLCVSWPRTVLPAHSQGPAHVVTMA